MTSRDQIYKCETCGNIVEMVGEGAGTLVCCGEPMTEMEANTVDAAKEKHVPVISVSDGKVHIKVGEVEHPMEESHCIEWIEMISGDRVDKQFLKPGQKPEADFEIVSDKFTARAYCNLHGLWTADK